MTGSGRPTPRWWRNGPLRNLGGKWADQREQNRLPDTETGEGHHEAVHAHPHSTGRRHAVLEGLEEVLVEHHRLGVTRRGEQRLLGEPLPLDDRVDQLGGGGAPFYPADVEIPLLRQPRRGAVRAGER